MYFVINNRPFHKTLPRSNASVNWMSVRFYETDCIQCSFFSSMKYVPVIELVPFMVPYLMFIVPSSLIFVPRSFFVSSNIPFIPFCVVGE